MDKNEIRSLREEMYYKDDKLSKKQKTIDEFGQTLKLSKFKLNVSNRYLKWKNIREIMRGIIKSKKLKWKLTQ